MMTIQYVSKNEFLSFIENEARFRIDSYIESAIAQVEEVHAGVKREDETSSFLETHTLPVTIDVIKYYTTANKPLTSVTIVSAILHDVLEENERILDLYTSKSYGFDAYFIHRFGDAVYKAVTTLKVKPLENYPRTDDKEPESERFRVYCNTLLKSEYYVKVIKLADRLNNMRFIAEVPRHEKINRYIREAEDFYLAYSILNPGMDYFYTKIRQAYEQLTKIRMSGNFLQAQMMQKTST